MAFQFFRNWFRRPTPVVSVDDLPAYNALGPGAPLRYGFQDGDKWPGGFGPTDLLFADYWTLRHRSTMLFETNLYARGLIRRLVTNEINTGLHLEATPAESILGVEQDGLAEWSEDVETRFEIWSAQPRYCDATERMTFGELQAQVRLDALVSGDVLCLLVQDQRTGLPRVRAVSGAKVQTPLHAKPRAGNRIVHGVEIDAQGRHVAYWLTQPNNESKRLPAFGERSGRRLAWLVYGTDKRLDDVRGKPILSLVLQSLREIDRYRDSVQRKAVINSILAMFIKKTEDKPGYRPMSTGAVRKGTEQMVDTKGETRTFNVAEHIPGLVLDELQTGEEPHGFAPTGTDEKFGAFEEAIVQTIAWANEIPPEILRLSFSSNYSASMAALNEFKLYLNRMRTDFGRAFCSPIYVEWLLSQVLTQKVEADGFLQAWRNPASYDLFGAWISNDWSGHIKPSTDVWKQARGYDLMLTMGLITHDRAARELTGTKFSQNVKKLARENEQLAKANEPIAQLEKSGTADGTDGFEPADTSDEDDATNTGGDDAKIKLLPVASA